MVRQKGKGTSGRAAARRGSVAATRAAAWLAAGLFAAAAVGALKGRDGGTVPDRAQALEPLVATPAPGSGDAPGAALNPFRADVVGDFELPAVAPVVHAPNRPLSDERARVDDPLLERRVEALVGKAVSDAARLTKNRATAQNCTVALRVVDLADGAVVLERNARTAVAPASNQKLVTSLSALVALGLDWQFETHVDAVGRRDGARLEGDLVVRGGGDPLFAEGDPDHADERLAELARSVAARGVREVTGDLVLDLGTFADAAPAPGWPTVDPWTSSYALAAGLTLNGGLVSYRVEPQSAGARARSAFVPAPTGLIEKLDVATVAGRSNDVRLGLYESTGRLELVGSIGAGLSTFVGDFRHPDPVAYFGHVFSRHLASAGVRVAGGVRRERDVAAGERLATIATPWTDYLEPINTHSNNAAADAVLLALGLVHEGRAEREAGARHVRAVLEGLGTQTSDFVQIDGSGLSQDNRVTVEILSELLARVAHSGDELREPFMASLAVAGSTGTLANRMTGKAAGRVLGKTGFIRGASALSGYVRTLEERELVFSIVVNYPRLDSLNTSCWKPMHDAIVEELVLWRRP